MNLKKDEVNNIIKVVEKSIPDVLAVYIYGSVATNRDTHESDLDIALFGSKPLSQDQLTHAKTKLEEAVGFESIDLVDLRSVPTTLSIQVISDGIVILLKDQKKVAEWETMTMSQYAHLNEERKEIIKDVQKRGKVYAG